MIFNLILFDFQVEIDLRKNYAIHVKHVWMRATDELDYGACRECRGASVETGIVPASCGDYHVHGVVRGPALGQEPCLLGLLAEVERRIDKRTTNDKGTAGSCPQRSDRLGPPLSPWTSSSASS